MSGKVTFHFDDGHISHYKQAFEVFKKVDAVGCLALIARVGYRMSMEQALEMQEHGWEILCHAKSHTRMHEPMKTEIMLEEIVESKRWLESEGFCIRQFVTPMSRCHESMIPLLKEHYKAAFTVYTNSCVEPIEQLVIQKPIQRFQLHRACMAKHTVDELKRYIDYVEANDAWLVFYDHDLGVGDNITAQMLEEVLIYCKKKGVQIVTSSEAIKLLI